MEKYDVFFSERSIKDLKHIPQSTKERIILKSESLAENPYPSGVKKLKGSENNFWRVRVGNYRVIYSVDDEIRIIDIRKVGHRKDIYK